VLDVQLKSRSSKLRLYHLEERCFDCGERPGVMEGPTRARIGCRCKRVHAPALAEATERWRSAKVSEGVTWRYVW